MRYQRSDGRPLVLAYHTAEEWADAMLDRFLALGCSVEVATELTRPIREASER